jgi:hypothetical protein
MKPKELAQELGVTPMRIGRLRKQLFPDAESGVDLTNEQVAAIREAMGILDSQAVRQEIEEAVRPTIIDAFIAYGKNGNRHAECALKQEDGSYKRIVALMPINMRVEDYIRKPVKLEVISYEDTTYYRHASLSGRAWGKLTSR